MALTPQQQQILNAIDMANSSGDAWATLGPEGVLAYMQDSLRKNYGTDDLSKFRYVPVEGVPGGYGLDWEGRQQNVPFDFKQTLRNAGLRFGTMTAGGGEDPRVLNASGDSGDGLGNQIALMNAAEGLNFGQTWEGKGGTGFAFYRKPDGSVGIKTGSLQSNDKGDIISALAVLGAAFGAQALTGAAGGAGAAAGTAGAAEGAAAAGAAGAGGAGAAAGTAGLVDLGGGLMMAADGSIVGTTLAGGAGMSGAALEGLISGAGAAGTAGVTGAVSGLGGIGGGAAGAGSLAAAGAGGAGSAGAGAAAGAAGAGSASTIGGLVSTITGGGGWGSLVAPALSLIGGAYTANQAGDAADAQIAAADRGIAENRRQFDLVRELLSPYVTAGTGALGSYRSLSGAAGPDAQRAEIAALEGSPQFGSLVRQGENAILQNASATGGLRGGNVQGALADYRTNVLSGLIDKQLGRYGGLIQVGQSSAAGTGNAAMGTGQQVSNLMQQQGAAQAGGIVAGTNAFTNALGGIGGFYATRGWQPSTTVPAVSGYGGAGVSGGGGFGTGTQFGNEDYGQYF